MLKCEIYDYHHHHHNVVFNNNYIFMIEHNNISLRSVHFSVTLLHKSEKALKSLILETWNSIPICIMDKFCGSKYWVMNFDMNFCFDNFLLRIWTKLGSVKHLILLIVSKKQLWHGYHVFFYVCYYHMKFIKLKLVKLKLIYHGHCIIG